MYHTTKRVESRCCQDLVRFAICSMSSQGVVYENIVQGGEGGCAPNVANLGTQRT